MKKLRKIAWERFSLNSSIVADGNGRFIATLFYFTIFVPFGLLSSLFMDPLRVRKAEVAWQLREPIPTDLESAREQS
ncbi:MAG: hypothetical protein OXE52_06385 [Chloroflexi bacterium]|nr:hypothetical protein [Chloroflexota bacterium]